MKIKAILILVALALAGCNAIDRKVKSQTSNVNGPANANAAHAPQQANDGVKRITTNELAELMKQGKVVVVDVRSQAMYDAGHIRGAKWISVTEIGNRANELPKDKQIVTYCS
ncbi:MAG TPA: rhodanese-like domain-containing protein [Pyrinomonadaceae bacterium]|nr:rhodanese-like domain-containing protein [Pyrinomonadaceae bacterium]